MKETKIFQTVGVVRERERERAKFREIKLYL